MGSFLSVLLLIPDQFSVWNKGRPTKVFRVKATVVLETE